MPTKKKSGSSPAPKLGDIAAELARARSRAGLSHSELHRITGISRTVLIGYEIGRTKPGSKEIRLLCDALKVTPNRLIYGSDDSPFEKGTSPFPEWMNFDSDDIGTVNTAVLLKMLNKEERLALLTLAHTILEARYGRQHLEEAFNALNMVGQAMSETKFLSRKTIDEFGKELGEKLEKKLSMAHPPPKKRGKLPNKAG